MVQAAIPQQKAITLDGLMELGSDARVEVIDGEIAYMAPVGGTHQFVAGNAFRTLDAFVIKHQLGYVIMDGLIYLLDTNNKHLKGALVPDVSFIRKSSIPKDWNIDLPFPGAPDLAVEVVSPNDDPDKLTARVQRYLEFGTEEVWVLYPKSKMLYRYMVSQQKTTILYHDGDTLEAELLFPGLKLNVGNLFTLPNFGA